MARQGEGWGIRVLFSTEEKKKMSKTGSLMMLHLGIVILPVPNLDQTITTTGHESPNRPKLWFAAHQASRRDSRCPTHGVDTLPMRGEDLVLPVPFHELKHRNTAIGRGAGEQTAGFMRGPRDDINRGRV